jgi:hypothetical protein
MSLILLESHHGVWLYGGYFISSRSKVGIITYGTRLHKCSRDVEWFDYIAMMGNFLRPHTKKGDIELLKLNHSYFKIFLHVIKFTLWYFAFLHVDITTYTCTYIHCHMKMFYNIVFHYMMFVQYWGFVSLRNVPKIYILKVLDYVIYMVVVMVMRFLTNFNN